MKTTKGIIGAICAPVPWWKRWWWKLFPGRRPAWDTEGKAFLDQVADQVAAKADTYPKYLWWRGHHIRIDARYAVLEEVEAGDWQPISEELRNLWCFVANGPAEECGYCRIDRATRAER